jgi:nucleoside 2-deoxyribosyltransferase
MSISRARLAFITSEARAAAVRLCDAPHRCYAKRASAPTGSVHMPTVYLAGPEVFLTDADEIGRRKQELCARYGFEGLYPLDNEIAAAAGERIDRLIYQANKAMMLRADIGICNLTPFRGPSADAGTVFELGLMAGLGKRVFAYSNEASDYGTRVAPATAGGSRDRLQMLIEDFGNADNLMLDWAVRESCGQPIVRHDGGADPFRDLTAFEQCLRLAAARL